MAGRRVCSVCVQAAFRVGTFYKLSEIQPLLVTSYENNIHPYTYTHLFIDIAYLKVVKLQKKLRIKQTCKHSNKNKHHHTHE